MVVDMQTLAMGIFLGVVFTFLFIDTIKKRGGCIVAPPSKSKRPPTPQPRTVKKPRKKPKKKSGS